MSTSAVEFSLGTNNSALKTGLDQARNQVEGFKNQTRQMLMGLFAGIGIEQLVEKFSHIQDMAETFGTTAEAVQRVDQYAQQFGTNIDTVARAMAKIRSGSGDVLGKLGIDAQQFANAGLDQQMVMVAESLEKVADPQQRVNMAFEALGPRAAAIVPILLSGSAAMKEFFGSADVASNETVAQLDAAGDRLNALKNKVTVVAADIFGFVDKVMLTIGSSIGSALSLMGNGIGRIGEALSALMNGDFKGMGAVLKANIDDIKSGVSGGVASIGDIWTGKNKPEQGPRKTGDWDPALGERGKKEEISLAERLRKIQEDHDRKQLEAAEQLKVLAEERVTLEKQLAEVGAGESDKKKSLEDKIVANAKEKLRVEDEIKAAADKEGVERVKQLDKEAAEYDKKLKQQEKIRKQGAEKQQKEDFAERERNLGFASGVKIAGADQGQQLKGVDYQVINAEAEKGIKLQEEMRNYLKSIDEKKWSVELPDAS